jgi:hypothetical protein
MVTRMATRADSGHMIMIVVIKAMLVVAPSNIVPRMWTAHPQFAYGLGLVVGVVLQNFVRPRLRPWQFCVMLALAVVAGVVAAKL